MGKKGLGWGGGNQEEKPILWKPVFIIVTVLRDYMCDCQFNCYMTALKKSALGFLQLDFN